MLSTGYTSPYLKRYFICRGSDYPRTTDEPTEAGGGDLPKKKPGAEPRPVVLAPCAALCGSEEHRGFGGDGELSECQPVSGFILGHWTCSETPE